MLITRGGTLGLFSYSIDRDGFFGKEVTDGCVDIEGDVSDTALNCARTCAVMALAFGCALLFFGGFRQFFCKLPCTRLVLTISNIGVQIMLALVWVVHANGMCNETKCSWGEGASFLLSTQLLYLGAGIFTRCLPEPRYERSKEEQKEIVPVEYAEQPEDQPEQPADAEEP